MLSALSLPGTTLQGGLSVRLDQSAAMADFAGFFALFAGIAGEGEDAPDGGAPGLAEVAPGDEQAAPGMALPQGGNNLPVALPVALPVGQPLALPVGQAAGQPVVPSAVQSAARTVDQPVAPIGLPASLPTAPAAQAAPAKPGNAALVLPASAQVVEAAPPLPDPLHTVSEHAGGETPHTEGRASASVDDQAPETRPALSAAPGQKVAQPVLTPPPASAAILPALPASPQLAASAPVPAMLPALPEPPRQSEVGLAPAAAGTAIASAVTAAPSSAPLAHPLAPLALAIEAAKQPEAEAARAAPVPPQTAEVLAAIRPPLAIAPEAALPVAAQAPQPGDPVPVAADRPAQDAETTAQSPAPAKLSVPVTLAKADPALAPAIPAPAAQPEMIAFDGASAPLAANPAPARAMAAQPAEAPQDFAAIVDRLAEAREAAAPHAVRTAVRNAEFGLVNVQFRLEAANLNVTLANADPGFAAAVQAASAASPSGRSAGEEQAPSQNQRQDGQAQPQQQAHADNGGSRPSAQSARRDDARERGFAQHREADHPAQDEASRRSTPTRGTGIYA